MNYQIKDIKNGYRIDTDGNMWSCLKRRGIKIIGGGESYLSNEWKKLTPAKDKDGYLIVILSPSRKLFKLHRLVAENFISNPKHKPLVCHKNGIPADNRVENLYWGTQRENLADARRHGTWPIGEKSPNAKLKNADIPLIRELLAHSKMSYKRIAQVFGVSSDVIERIARGKTWVYIT